MVQRGTLPRKKNPKQRPSPSSPSIPQKVEFNSPRPSFFHFFLAESDRLGDLSVCCGFLRTLPPPSPKNRLLTRRYTTPLLKKISPRDLNLTRQEIRLEGSSFPSFFSVSQLFHPTPSSPLPPNSNRLAFKPHRSFPIPLTSPDK